MSAAVAADVGAERESMSAGEPAPVATSRQPGPADQLAMLAEQSPTGWIFRRPGQTAPGSFGLVVLDRAREVEQWSRPVAAPVLTIVGRASADERQQLTQRLGLRDPLVIGGGWDVPDTWLGVGRVASRGSRIEAVREAIARHGSAVVVTSSRDRAARLALSLTGLRTALWAPTKRPGPAIGAIGAWRSGRLDALVIPAGELPSVGRKRVPLLLHADAPESTDSWRDVVAAVGPAAAVLLLGPDAPADVAGLLDGCVRAGLLEQYGELLEAPCGRCSNED